jgi:perosamine synthetase
MSVPIYRPFIRRKQMDSVLSSLVDDKVFPGEAQKNLVKDLSVLTGKVGGLSFMEAVRAIQVYFDFHLIEAEQKILLSPLVSQAFLYAAEQKGILVDFLDVYENTPVLDCRELSVNWDSYALLVTNTSLGFFPDLEALDEIPIPVLLDISDGLGVNDLSGHLEAFKGDLYISLGYNPFIESGAGAVILFSSKRQNKAFVEHCAALPVNLQLSDLNASLGVEILKERDLIVQRQREIFEHLAHKLRRGGHSLPTALDEKELSHGFFPVSLESGAADVLSYCSKNGLPAGWPLKTAPLPSLQIARMPCPMPRVSFSAVWSFPSILECPMPPLIS